MSDHNCTPKQAKKTMKVVYLEDATIQSQIIHLLGYALSRRNWNQSAASCCII